MAQSPSLRQAYISRHGEILSLETSTFSASAPASPAPSSALSRRISVLLCLLGLPIIPNTFMSLSSLYAILISQYLREFWQVGKRLFHNLFLRDRSLAFACLLIGGTKLACVAK